MKDVMSSMKPDQSKGKRKSLSFDADQLINNLDDNYTEGDNSISGVIENSVSHRSPSNLSLSSRVRETLEQLNS